MVEQIRQREEATRRRAEKALHDAREVSARLRKLTVTIYAKTGEAGRLFGSVTNATSLSSSSVRPASRSTSARSRSSLRSSPWAPRGGDRAPPEVTETLRIVVAAK